MLMLGQRGNDFIPAAVMSLRMVSQFEPVSAVSSSISKEQLHNMVNSTQRKY